MTRDELLANIRVLDEGTQARSIYEIDDAKAALKPLARYFRRQALLSTACSIFGLQLGPHLLPAWPTYVSSLAGAFALLLVGALVLRIPYLHRLFAPAGLTLEDVGKGARHVLS